MGPGGPQHRGGALAAGGGQMDEHAAAIADVLHRYELLQSDRKPELLNRLTTWNRAADLAKDPDKALVYSDADPFSLVDYAEHQRIAADFVAGILIRYSITSR